MTIRDILLNEAVPTTLEGWKTKFEKQNRVWYHDSMKEVVDAVNIARNLNDKYKGSYLNVVFNNWMADYLKKKDSAGVNNVSGLGAAYIMGGNDQDAINMYFENKNKESFKEIIKPMNDIMNKRFVGDISLEDSNEIGDIFDEFHNKAVEVLQKTGKIKKVEKREHFRSGSWVVYNPTSFEEAVASSTINNPDDTSVNRKAAWCTAASKGYFNNYPNIYIIKREANGKGDRGVMLQMNWGQSKRDQFNFKDEDDASVRKGLFEKNNIPTDVLKSIKAPKGHELEGQTLDDLLNDANEKIDKAGTKEKTRSRMKVGDFEIKSYNYRNNGDVVVKKKLEENLPGFDFSVMGYGSSKNITDVESVIKKGEADKGFVFRYDLYKSKSMPDIIGMLIRGSDSGHITAKGKKTGNRYDLQNNSYWKGQRTLLLFDMKRQEITKGSSANFPDAVNAYMYRKDESVLYDFVNEILL